MRAAVLALALTLPYWPGESGGLAEPVYPHRIEVIDTLGVSDVRAAREWNACGSVRLVRGPLSLAEQPGTITILTGEKGDWPRGGWAGDHGVLLLPPGAWRRSVPVIRHELGHALGFGHTKLWSVMGGAPHVKTIDCEGLRHYYG